MVEIGNEVEVRVLNALDQDERTQGEEIGVMDKEGVVRLQGSVSTNQVRAIAEEITAAQDGVVEVINDLEVEAGDDDPDGTPIPPHWLGRV